MEYKAAAGGVEWMDDYNENGVQDKIKPNQNIIMTL